jgi:inorganic pyrophosphatase
MGVLHDGHDAREDEAAQGRRTRFKYVPEKRVFAADKMLPEGSVFPFDFGFLPSTEGEDGDPLDILVLMEEPAFPGCLVPALLIGVIEAEQAGKDGKTIRNDRLAVSGRIAQKN